MKEDIKSFNIEKFLQNKDFLKELEKNPFSEIK
jgi:hypothetical protein